MWDKNGGGLVKKLEGPKEGLIDLKVRFLVRVCYNTSLTRITKWHPKRPLIASLSGFGTIFLWSVNYVQNFSAFAPSFTELEDNIEYRERESEFDAVEVGPCLPTFEQESLT